MAVSFSATSHGGTCLFKTLTVAHSAGSSQTHREGEVLLALTSILASHSQWCPTTCVTPTSSKLFYAFPV